MATQEMTIPGMGSDFSSANGRNGSANGASRRAVDALGWFSVGLGITEIVAPRALAGLIGVRPRAGIMRLMGLREVAAGIGILSSRRPAPWLWARFAGDLVDLAALAAGKRDGGRTAAAIGAVAAVTVVDGLCAQRHTSASSSTRFTAAVAINRSREECYNYWHDFEKLPSFIEHLKSVRSTGGARSHWVTKGPLGEELAWDAEITEDVPNEVIAWRSLEGGDLSNWGRVRFESAPAGRGTVVRVLVNYEPPLQSGGPVWAAILGADPGERVRRDLMRFKQLLEAGEIATTEGQPAGRRSGANWLDRAVRI